jgi:type VI secretion system protein ImpE
MLAEQSLRNGNLDQALAELQDELRRHPSDAKKRVFLFQLLIVVGQWQRALTQLRVLAELDAGSLPMAHTYGEAIRCELLRAEVFSGRATPLVFGSPERWLALLIEALRLSAEDRFEQAQPLRDEAFALAPAVSGTIDTAPFAWIADGDPRLGPVLEAIVNGAYYWVPFQHIRQIRLAEPEDLRDLVWTSGEFAWANGGTSVGLIPTRYPGSEACEDSRLRLSRMTIWREPAAGLYLGLGQRVFATDVGEFSLLDTRLITLNAASPVVQTDQSQGERGETSGDG